MSTYLFDNAGEQTRQRFTSLETLYDPWTIRRLEATGIGAGWRCWEIGAGGGSIAAWLGERCGKSGHVLVTDIDPHFLVENALLAQPPIEIQCHAIGIDPLPAQRFDLIHARLVLHHVPARKQALQQMVLALAPGGWLVVEDFDPSFIDRGYPTSDAIAAALFRKVAVAQGRLMAARSGEEALTWGRSLYQRLREQGLVNVGMEGYLTVWDDQSPGECLDRANFLQIRQEALDAGLLTHEEIDQVLALLDDSAFAISLPVMFTAWGRSFSSDSRPG